MTYLPDYIFQDADGLYFVVEEKYQRRCDPLKQRYSNNINRYADDNWLSPEDAEDKLKADEEEKRILREEEERIIEEWKHYKGYFFSNHIIQVLSYIKNIKEYSLSYGYLLYWYYDFEDNMPYINKVVSKRIEFGSKEKNTYEAASNKILELKKTGKVEFKIADLSMKKCAACAVNKYCGHKSGRYEELTLPYSINYLGLFYPEFPRELKSIF